MAQLSPSGYQKVLQVLQSQQSRQMQRAQSPAQRPGPSGTDLGLSAAGQGLRSVGGLSSLFGGNPTLSRGLEGAGSVLGGINAIRSFATGRPIPGAAQLLGATGSGLRALGVGGAAGAQLGTGLQSAGGILGGAYGLSRGATVPGALGLAGGVGKGLQTLAPLAPRYLGISPSNAQGLGTLGGGLAGAAGLGTGIYGLTQGDIPGGVQGLLGGAAGLASLAPAGATLGGVPIASAGSLFAGAAPSIAGAAGALAIPVAAGVAVENIVNAILGEGAFGQTPLPFTNRGASNWLSSADNAASQISAMTGLRGATQLQGMIQSAEDPGQLLGLALAGPGLSPHGELQFYMVGPNGETLSGGKGGVQQEPTNPIYSALVRRAAQGDPAALHAFISRVRIQSGESGAATDNYLLTDWYRRKLTSLLPEENPVRQDLAGLFEPTPTAYGPTGRAQAYLDAIAQLNEQYAPAGGPAYSAEDAIRGLMAGNVGHTTLSQLFRPPEELIDRAAAERFVAGNTQFNRPRSEIPGTAEYAAKYLPQL